MAKYSSMFASISPGMDVDTATDGLVSIMKAFDIGNDNPDDVLDGIMSKVNIIGNTAATSNAEIVNMLSKSSSAMKEANNTLEETIALETAAVEITRDDDSVGTAFKTVSMRLRGYDEETEEYIGGVEELSGKIADLTKTASTPGGISLFTDDAKTEYKSTYQLLKEISEVYDELDDKTQAQLLEALAGKRQGQIVAATINNFQAAEKAIDNMANSAGSAEREMSVIMDSLDYKLNKNKETWTGVSQNLFQRDDMKAIVDAFTSIGEAVDFATDKLGLFGTIGLGAGLLASFKNVGIFKQETIKSWFSGVGTSVNNEVIQPFQNANSVISKYNLAIQHNSLTQQGWQRLLAQSDDSLKAYLTSIKGSTASMAGYNVSLQGSITGFTKVSSAIKQYNALGTVSLKEQQAFATAVSATNSKLGTYLIGLNGSTAGLRGYGVSLVASTAKTIGLTVATTALNAAMTMGISVIVTGLISAFTSWINKSEEITEKAQESADKINSISESLKTNTETVENAKRRYAELAQEVENLGKITQSQGALSNEEYEEFLDLSNQLAGIFPSLTKNYDENGNAILDLSGDVNTIVGSLDDLVQKEKELANQKIMEEFPDVFKGYTQDVSDAEAKVKSAKTEFDKINNAYQQLAHNGSTVQAFDLNLNGVFTNEDGEEVATTMNEYTQALEDLGIAYKKSKIWKPNQFGGKDLSGYLVEATGDIDTAFTSKLETARENLQYAQQQLEGKKSSIDSYLNTWLQTEFSYNQIEDSGLQTAIQDMLFNFDFSNIPENKRGDWNYVSEYLRRNILFEINKVQDDPVISSALSEVFTNAELTPDEKANYLQQIQDFFGEDSAIVISLKPQIEETDTLQKQYDDAITKFGEESQDTLQKFFKDNSINDSSEIDYWNSVTKGAKSAEEAVKMYNDAKKDGNETDILSFADVLNSDDNKDVANELKTLAEAGELTPNTLTSTKEYNELLKETGTTAKEATEQLYNMVDANTRLSAFSTNMSNVDKAYSEFKTNGFNTMDDFSGLESAFGDLNSYKKFIQVAGDAKSSTQEIQNAYNKLVTEYVYSTGILDTVNESNRGLIQTQLEHLGITNAEEIVTKALNGDILSLASAKSILTQYGYDLISVTSGELNALVKEGNISKETAKQIALFALKKKIANGVSITTDGDIANLAALAGVSSDVIEMMGSLATMKQKIEQGIGEAGTAGGKEELEKHAKALEKRINNRLNKGTQVNFNVDYTGGEATTTAIDKQVNKNKETYTKFSQTIDWCAETITNLTNKIGNLNAKLNNTDALQNQIKYYKQLINAQNGLVKGYEKTADRYQKVYNKALKKLSKADQNKVKNGAYTIEQFSGKAKSGKKSGAEKRYNNIQKAIEARDNVVSNSNNLIDAKAQLKEYAEGLASIRWDKASEKVDKLSNSISVLDTKLSNASGYKAKSAILKEQLELQKQSVTAQENAVKNTQNDANGYLKKISSKYKKNKNKDGTIKTTGVTDKAQLKLITVYNAYVRKLAEETVELKQAQEDYKAAVNDAAISNSEFVQSDYDNKVSLLEATENRLNSEIALAEARGQVASADYYKSLTDNAEKIKKQRYEEKALLEEQIKGVKPYTDTWYILKQAIFDVQTAIATETQNAVENINKQIEAVKKLTDAKNDYLSSTIGTNDWLADLTDSDDYSDENGNFTDKGLAIIKSRLNNVELYKQQVENLKGNINELDTMHENGEIDDATWMNNRIELVEELQNVTKSMYDEERSLHDMYIQNLKEQSEALQDLIDKKMEALEADKSEYDYRKSIAEKTKNIADLQKQLAMLKGDNSEEAMAQKQKLKVQLEDAQEDLEDTQYEKYLERLEDSLDDLQDRFDAIIDKLDKQGALPSIEELTSLVNENADSVTDGVKQIIEDAGLNEILGENGLGYLNTTANDLLNSPESQVATKIDETNTWLGKIYDATIGGSTDDSSNDSGESGATTISSTQQNTTGITGTIGTEKIAIPGENILQKAAEHSLPKSDTSTNTSVLDILDMDGQNLTSGNNEVLLSKTTANKAKTFINQNATKAKKKKSEYGILNKKIYEMTDGKVLSKENRLKLASMLSVTDTNKDGDITGAEAKKVVELLKQIPGFSSGGIVEVAKRNGDDGWVTLKAGESVLTPVQTDALIELGKNLVPLNNFMDIIQRPNLDGIARSNNPSSTSIDSVNFEFNLPNVVDSESLIKTIQNDTKLQRTLQNATVGKLNGNTRLGVKRL